MVISMSVPLGILLVLLGAVIGTVLGIWLLAKLDEDERKRGPFR